MGKCPHCQADLDTSLENIIKKDWYAVMDCPVCNREILFASVILCSVSMVGLVESIKVALCEFEKIYNAPITEIKQYLNNLCKEEDKLQVKVKELKKENKLQNLWNEIKKIKKWKFLNLNNLKS